MFNFGFWTTVSQERCLHIDLRLITKFLKQLPKGEEFGLHIAHVLHIDTDFEFID